MAGEASVGQGASRAAIGAEPTSERIKHALQAVLPIVVLILAWEVASQTRTLNPAFFPAPTTVIATIVRLTQSGEILDNLWITMFRVTAGFLFGVIPAVLIGLLMGWSPVFHRAVDPIIAATYPIPKIALLPLLIVLFGLGETPIIVLTAVVCFYPVAVNTIAGVRGVEPVLIRMASNLGASRVQILRMIVLPGALPVVIAGFRLAIGLALLGDVAAEFVVAQDGLGAYAWLYWQIYRIDNMYAYLVVISLIGVILSYGLVWVERKAMPWSRPIR